MNLKLSHDGNGNKIITIKPVGSRGFSVQTLGNLPEVHRMSADTLDHAKAINEINGHIKQYGTDYQKAVLGW